MSRREIVLWIMGYLLIAAIVLGAWWSPRQPRAQEEQLPISLKAAFTARTLTLHPDGCVELRTDGGRRAFVFAGKTWRECPKKGGGR